MKGLVGTKYLLFIDRKADSDIRGVSRASEIELRDGPDRESGGCPLPELFLAGVRG